MGEFYAGLDVYMDRSYAVLDDEGVSATGSGPVTRLGEAILLNGHLSTSI